MNVSIVIATYGDDAWKKLAKERAFPSAHDQGAFEIVIGHDSHAGIAGTRNALAAKTTGDWLCFLDADDQLGPNYIRAMQRASEQRRGGDGAPPPLLTPAVQQIRNGKLQKRPFFFPECSFETGNWLIIGTLVQRDLFMEVGGFHDHPHGLEDWVLWASCVKAGAEIMKVPQAIYIAHYSRDSRHHQLQRDRRAYMKAYETARAEVWG